MLDDNINKVISIGGSALSFVSYFILPDKFSNVYRTLSITIILCLTLIGLIIRCSILNNKLLKENQKLSQQYQKSTKLLRMRLSQRNEAERVVNSCRSFLSVARLNAKEFKLEKIEQLVSEEYTNYKIYCDKGETNNVIWKKNTWIR